jgi:ABC-2 type transport system ATP-binding protein
VNDPDVVFLDEPTTGLDPQARRRFWELIRSVNQEGGKTIILTTHYLEEAELLSDRVAIIDHGRIQAIDTPTRLIRGLSSASRIRFTASDGVDLAELRALPGVVTVEQVRSGRYEVNVSAPRDALAELLWRNSSVPTARPSSPNMV